MQVINLRFCYILLLDKIRFAGSALSYDLSSKGVRISITHLKKFIYFHANIEVSAGVSRTARKNLGTNMLAFVFHQ